MSKLPPVATLSKKSVATSGKSAAPTSGEDSAVKTVLPLIDAQPRVGYVCVCPHRPRSKNDIELDQVGKLYVSVRQKVKGWYPRSQEAEKKRQTIKKSIVAVEGEIGQQQDLLADLERQLVDVVLQAEDKMALSSSLDISLNAGTDPSPTAISPAADKATAVSRNKKPGAVTGGTSITASTAIPTNNTAPATANTATSAAVPVTSSLAAPPAAALSGKKKDDKTPISKESGRVPKDELLYSSCKQIYNLEHGSTNALDFPGSLRPTQTPTRKVRVTSKLSKNQQESPSVVSIPDTELPSMNSGGGVLSTALATAAGPIKGSGKPEDDDNCDLESSVYSSRGAASPAHSPKNARAVDLGAFENARARLTSAGSVESNNTASEQAQISSSIQIQNGTNLNSSLVGSLNRGLTVRDPKKGAFSQQSSPMVSYELGIICPPAVPEETFQAVLGLRTKRLEAQDLIQQKKNILIVLRKREETYVRMKQVTDYSIRELQEKMESLEIRLTQLEQLQQQEDQKYIDSQKLDEDGDVTHSKLSKKTSRKQKG